MYTDLIDSDGSCYSEWVESNLEPFGNWFRRLSSCGLLLQTKNHFRQQRGDLRPYVRRR